MIEGKPDVKRITEIDLAELGRKFRMQKIIFETAAGRLRPDEAGLEGEP